MADARVREATAPRLIVGTIVVAFVLAFSRWGTNIGISPLFISDALIALSVVHLWVSRGFRGPLSTDSRARGVTPLFVVFFAFIGTRVLLSLGQANMLDWLRDSIPFLYAILAFLAAYGLRTSTSVTRAATARVLRWALTIHLLWVACVALTDNSGGFDVLGPLSAAPVLQVRPDIDVAIIGVAAGACFRQVLLGRRRFWNLAGMTLALLVVFTTTGTRAGQISLVICLAAAFAFTYAASRQAQGRRLAMAFLVPALLAATLIVLPTTSAGERLIATVAPQLSANTDGQLNAQGTQRAREMTWDMVITWTNEQPARALFGSGFGNDFLQESGTKAFLEGTTYTNVRSPHNWFVGIYARLGIIGLALAVLWVGQLMLIMWQTRQKVGADDLLAVASLTVLAIIPVATLGVVLEAPFGAIPFFWAAGLIMASRARLDSLSSKLPVTRSRLTRRAAARIT
ncbi:O-antigen ligase family protein [Microbacterium aurantiacum]|uniref:O-antigen ligase family protein n=1 Tax=Microbacterium aurantiacum TaxID=162393 RepID=A0AAJ2LYG8_9MICO|nr:O-antigen ligase family protein [Microbacterium aurantiacum]MDS0244254.1 O-antigen ligase family protein [Microbacterium aurantiacum]